MIDRERAEQEFLKYASAYDINDIKIKLKVDHTLRVTKLCTAIAESLGLDKEDEDIAYTTGLLHDIGRFEQVRIYHTFKDSESVNHAHFSADLLFREGMIRNYTAVTKYDSLIEKAIRFHNAYRLPDTLTDRERMFCQILRDADKIDILRVNWEIPMTEIYDLPEEEFLLSEISEPVFQDLMALRDVNRANSKTGIDFLLGHIAFVYGLVYPVSFRLVREQGYLEKMLAFESRNEKTRLQMEQIRREIKEYIDEHI